MTTNPSSEGQDLSPASPLIVVFRSEEDRDAFPARAFHGLNCKVMFFDDPNIAIDEVTRLRPAIVVLPLKLKGYSTLNLLGKLTALKPAPNTLIVGTNDRINDAAEAMRVGATDCLFVPFTPERLTKSLQKLIPAASRFAKPLRGPRVSVSGPRAESVARRIQSGDGAYTDEKMRHGMVLSDMSVAAVVHALETISHEHAPIMITGETGSGKELLARAFHAETNADSSNFVSVPCATLRADRFMVEFFGEAAGGPSHTKGYLERAKGGTLFLDEFGAASLEVQNKLAHVMEQHHNLDIRVIGTNTESPTSALANGSLLKRLFFLLNVLPVALPPLRERGDDILRIAQIKLLQFSEERGRNFRGFSREAEALLLRYSWPGNVRELNNLIWRIVQQFGDTLVQPEMLPEELHDNAGRNDGLPIGLLNEASLLDMALDQLVGKSLAEVERLLVERTIETEDGSLPRAAQILGVSPSTLYRKRDMWLGRD